MACCPTCRQELPDRPDIGVSLDTNHAVARGHFIYLPPDQAVVLVELLRTWPSHSTHDEIKLALWGKLGQRPADPNGIMRTQVTRVKKTITPLGYSVVCVWGKGYRLVDSGVPVVRPKVVAIR